MPRRDMPGQWIRFHDFDINPIGVTHAGPALASLALHGGQRLRAESGETEQRLIKISHP
ncbi:hypothetical protein D9M73_212880 [compost metagenome]